MIDAGCRALAFLDMVSQLQEKQHQAFAPCLRIHTPSKDSVNRRSCSKKLPPSVEARSYALNLTFRSLNKDGNRDLTTVWLRRQLQKVLNPIKASYPNGTITGPDGKP